MKAGSRPLRKIVAYTISVLCLLLVAACIWIFSYSRMPGPRGDGDTVVLIPQGSSFQEISHILAEAGVINDDIRFYILARIEGIAEQLHAGEFVLPYGRRPMEVLRILSRAKVVQHPVTIAEGLAARDIAAVFSQGSWCSREKFLSLVNDPDFAASLGLHGLISLEGYLYPDTYYLTRIPSFTAEKIIKMMVNRFFQVWSELDTGSVNRHETVTLASIVEKETAENTERPRIASVFLNRLRKGIRLQSDPTVIYGMDNFSGNISKNDLQQKTPYNTYVISGLPEGPICNPGKAALEAVLHPAIEDNLYFVSKNDGTHHFSKTLGEHNRAVFLYQKKKEQVTTHLISSDRYRWNDRKHIEFLQLIG